jgi:fructokinase
MSAALVGAIELGGTKINCAIGTGPTDIRAEAIFPTNDPRSTIAAAIDFLQRHSAGLKAVGVASFGPVCLDQNNPKWGYITDTTKPNWSDTAIAPAIRNAMGIDVAFDTDVNGAALGEYRWGALADCPAGLYLTIGTGVGGGLVIDGKPLHGRIHPEMGHLRIKRDPADPFGGTCPFHSDCFEGLVSGPAIMARLGCTLSDVERDSPQRGYVIDALGQSLATLTLILSPHRVVIGGGVAKTPDLHTDAIVATRKWLSGYATIADDFIVPPQLGDYAGVSGAIALAQDMLAVR